MPSGLASLWRDRLLTMWPQAQGAAAATIAWLIAEQIPHDRAPFFAPIAAFSQLLFSPQPIRLLRQAEASLLRDLAERLKAFADASRTTTASE